MTIKEVSEQFGISPDTLRYYERIGMIPEVSRTSGGIRNYQDADLGWVELAICMRNAGLPIETLTEYVKLYQMGDGTLEARLQLLQEQEAQMLQQRAQIDTALARLRYKISRYQAAMETGTLTWKKEDE